MSAVILLGSWALNCMRKQSEQASKPCSSMVFDGSRLEFLPGLPFLMSHSQNDLLQSVFYGSNRQQTVTHSKCTQHGQLLGHRHGYPESVPGGGGRGRVGDEAYLFPLLI